jgi:hypothetical protein
MRLHLVGLPHTELTDEFSWYSECMRTGRPPTPADQRFWLKVHKKGLGGCWLWLATKDSHGYGVFAIVKEKRHRCVGAHRWAYERLVAPIPQGLVIDHLCRVRHCVNPTHMEIVSVRENTLRGVGITAQYARRSQ